MTCPGCATEDRKVYARGLCSSCYQWYKYNGMIHMYPRVYRTKQDWAEDYEWLLPEYGDAFEGIAARLGVSAGTLERALYRAGYKIKYSEDGRKVMHRAG